MVKGSIPDRTRNLIEEITTHYERYSYPLVKPPKWYADKAAIKRKLRVSDYLAAKLEKILDTVVLPGKPIPTKQHPGPERVYGRNLVNPNFLYEINKEYISTLEQREAYIPLDRKDNARSEITK